MRRWVPRSNDAPALLLLFTLLAGGCGEQVINLFGDPSLAGGRGGEGGGSSGSPPVLPGGMAGAAGDAGAAGRGDGGSLPDCVARCRPVLALESDGGVDIPDGTVLDFSQSYTLELWLKLRSLRPSGALMRKIVDDKQDLRILIEEGRVVFSHSLTTGGAERVTSTELMANEWHHVALSRAADLLTLHLDGQLIDEEVVDGLIPAFPGPSYIGALPADLQQPDEPGGVPMLLAGIRLSTVTRYSDPFDPPPTLPLDFDAEALWQFDDGQGERLFDVSGGGHHAFLRGDAKWIVTSGP